jgi:hypothetical protein
MHNPPTREGTTLSGWPSISIASSSNFSLLSGSPTSALAPISPATIAVALLWPLPSLLFGRTVVDAEGIRQIGWMGREATWQQVQRVRFVRLALSPRLIVSVGLGRARVFYSGSRELDLAFEQAVALLTAPRQAEPPA